MTDYADMRQLFSRIGAEFEDPGDDNESFQRQLSDAPRHTRHALRLHSTWFYFDRDEKFIGYAYAGYDEEEHIVHPVKRVKS